MKGRKPASPDLKLIRGERPDRIPADAPRAVQGLLEPPAHLDEVAREEWARIVEELGELGVLSRSDRAALALYCMAYSRYRKAHAEIEAGGLTSSTAAGGEKTNPAVGVLERAEAAMAKLLSEFGATPSARNRVKVASDDGPKDALGEFLLRRKA